MSVVQVSSAPDRESYEKVRALLPGTAPKGLIAHAAAELPDGSVQIVDVYESREEMEAFETSSLLPAFAQAGLTDEVQSRPRPTPYEAFLVQRGGS